MARGRKPKDIPFDEVLKLVKERSMTLYGIAANVLVLCDVAVSRHFTLNLKLMFDEGTNAKFCTSPAILQSTCYLPYLI